MCFQKEVLTEVDLRVVLCSVPFSLWVGSLFVATLSYYTSDYMRQGQDAPEKRNERYVYDPTAGVPSTPPVQVCGFRV